MSKLTCENCGLCCMHMRTPPFCGETDPEWEALPEALKRELDSWLKSPRMDLLEGRGQQDSLCVWLNQCTGQCRRYASRPQICRDFHVGSEACLKYRADAERAKRELESRFRELKRRAAMQPILASTPSRPATDHEQRTTDQ